VRKNTPPAFGVPPSRAGKSFFWSFWTPKASKNSVKFSSLPFRGGLGRGFLFFLILLTACAPIPAAQPISQLATRAVQAPAASPTARATLAPTPTFTAQPTQPPTPTPTPVQRFGEPAGCRIPDPGETLEQRLAIAETIYAGAGSFNHRLQFSTWNSVTAQYELTGKDVLALQVNDIGPKYRVQELANALFVAGFVPWLRLGSEKDLHILAVALRPGVLDSIWGSYVSAYFAGPLSEPANDLSVVPMLRLTPCDWMIQQGYAPPVPAGELEMAAWDQPDFTAAAQSFLADTTEEAFQVSYQIDWLEGDTESPASMCGPLTWAINAQSGALPPGYGAWSTGANGAKSFWLPKPVENGRPWNLFPPWMYTLDRHPTPIAKYDFTAHPLNTGDIIYTYAALFGFDHILMVTEKDVDGGVYAVTNLIKNKPKPNYTIRRVLLFTPVDPAAGIYRNQWTTDRVNGRTGQKGFEIFRWKWREKDILKQAAPYTVMIGDTLPLVAALWHTPPEAIAAANGLDPAQPLRPGAEIMIPPNP
jgi:hypothetical protein